MYNSFTGLIRLHFGNKVGYKSRELFPKQCMGGYCLGYIEYHICCWNEKCMGQKAA